MLLLAVLAIARSGKPSLLKSPVAIELGELPTTTSSSLVKLPPPAFSNKLTLLLPWLAIAKSILPSTLKSIAVIATGLVPTGMAGCKIKLKPWFSIKTATFCFPLTTAKSSLLSPSKSAAIAASGKGRLPKLKVGKLMNPDLVFNSNDMLLSPLFATKSSGLLSPLIKSAAKTLVGALPTGLSSLKSKFPEPALANKEMLLLPKFGTTKSAFPSRSKSVTVSDSGFVLTDTSLREKFKVLPL
jgi:hypothetical protein